MNLFGRARTVAKIRSTCFCAWGKSRLRAVARSSVATTVAFQLVDQSNSVVLELDEAGKPLAASQLLGLSVQ